MPGNRLEHLGFERVGSPLGPPWRYRRPGALGEAMVEVDGHEAGAGEMYYTVHVKPASFEAEYEKLGGRYADFRSAIAAAADWASDKGACDEGRRRGGTEGA